MHATEERRITRVIAPAQIPHTGADRPDLNPLVNKWASILKLQDWEIKARYVRHWDLQDGNEAQARISIRLKTCSVLMMDPVDYADGSFPQDVERTLVHELVHCHLEFFGKAEGLAYDMREQAVESLTRAFIELDRRP